MTFHLLLRRNAKIKNAATRNETQIAKRTMKADKKSP